MIIENEKKDGECCGTTPGKSACGCCCGKKIFVMILAILLIFGIGYYLGQKNMGYYGSGMKICPISGKMMPESPAQK